MTPQEAFKFGFKMQCAREGLDEDATAQRATVAAMLVKRAGTEGATPVGGMLSDAWRAGTGAVEAGAKAVTTGIDVTKSIADKAFWPLVLAPVVAGVGGGYVLSQMTDDHYSDDDARKDEELAEYQRALDQITRANRQSQK